MLVIANLVNFPAKPIKISIMFGKGSPNSLGSFFLILNDVGEINLCPAVGLQWI
jgi:hypothetical protein